MEIVQGSILDQEGAVDGFVSPANTIGNMDGGIDKAYATHFGWSPGRPYHDPNPLQLAIDARNGASALPELPIGEGIAVPVERSDPARTVRYLLAAPTMVTPGALPAGSRNVHEAALAAFRVWREREEVASVACPMFGTGWGRVPPWVAAAQMWEAFVQAWS